jgi:DHA1 family tetracycline resistance protein-like MFS transporter
MMVGVFAIIVQGRLIGIILPKVGERRGLMGALCIAATVTILYGLATEGWMVYVLICFGSFGGIAAPATHALITKRVPVDEQGAVQGALASLVSLANVFAPPIAAWSFSACIKPDAWIHVPGIAFFEASILIVLALVIASRAVRPEART